MDNEKIESPKNILILEDNLACQDFFKAWAKKTYPTANCVHFDSIKETTNWIKKEKNNLTKDPLLSFIDIGLPDGNGLDIIKSLTSINPKCKSIVITIQDDHDSLFQALRFGADGYILKHENEIFLEKLLLRITQGECPLSPSIALKVIKHFHTTDSTVECNLTAREQETLSLIAKGLTVQETAIKMGLSPSTVSGYVKVIYQKLHISSRAEATQQAIKLGLI